MSMFFADCSYLQKSLKQDNSVKLKNTTVLVTPLYFSIKKKPLKIQCTAAAAHAQNTGNLCVLRTLHADLMYLTLSSLYLVIHSCLSNCQGKVSCVEKRISRGWTYKRTRKKNV